MYSNGGYFMFEAVLKDLKGNIWNIVVVFYKLPTVFLVNLLYLNMSVTFCIGYYHRWLIHIQKLACVP